MADKLKYLFVEVPNDHMVRGVESKDAKLNQVLIDTPDKSALSVTGPSLTFPL